MSDLDAAIIAGWDDVDATITDAWENGQVVVMAVLAEGGQTGQRVANVIDPTALTEVIAMLTAMSARKQKAALRSVCGAVRTAVTAWGSQRPAPAIMDNLMLDLTLLMGFKLMRQTNRVLAGSGLRGLALAVDPDATKPWNRRGLLTPDDATHPDITRH